MTVIFKAKTTDAFGIKILAELLQNNIKIACFKVNEEGIKLTMMDSHQTVLIDLSMESENFTIYKFKSKEPLYLGINLNHFHQMLKSIKKKDSLQLFINDEAPNDLGIKVIPKENTRVTTSFVTIQQIQNLDIDIPNSYGKPIIVPSTDYQKMIKDMAGIGKTINIIARNFHVQFGCNAGGIMKRKVDFGESNDSDSDEENENIEYNKEFDTEQLSRIIKIAGLGSNIKIYPKTENPLMFRTNIGNLGFISIYIKSKDLMEKDRIDEYCDDDSDNEKDSDFEFD